MYNVTLHLPVPAGEFVDANEALLKQLPPPLVAATYYRSTDLYMFDEFQTSKQQQPRRPPCSNLYDVFSNIRWVDVCHVISFVDRPH